MKNQVAVNSIVRFFVSMKISILYFIEKPTLARSSGDIPPRASKTSS